MASGRRESHRRHFASECDPRGQSIINVDFKSNQLLHNSPTWFGPVRLRWEPGCSDTTNLVSETLLNKEVWLWIHSTPCHDEHASGCPVLFQFEIQFLYRKRPLDEHPCVRVLGKYRDSTIQGRIHAEKEEMSHFKGHCRQDTVSKFTRSLIPYCDGGACPPKISENKMSRRLSSQYATPSHVLSFGESLVSGED